jgi:hypothetical protein
LKNKKSLKGFLKSTHFEERQKQRKVSDLEVSKAILEGSLIENNHLHIFKLGELSVTVDLENSTLITVHPGEKESKKKKLLTKAEAKIIMELIRLHKQKMEKQEENEFLNYASANSIKKLN